MREAHCQSTPSPGEELEKIAEATAAGTYEAKGPGTVADDRVAAITSNF